MRSPAVALSALALAACDLDSSPSAECDAAITPIHAIQGEGPVSRLLDRPAVTTTGIVTLAIPGYGAFIQTPDPAVDNSARTSEGLLVLTDSPPEAGVRLVATGTVIEHGPGDRTTTAIAADAITSCESSAMPKYREIERDALNLGDWERLEGMRVTFPKSLTVADLNLLDDEGQITVLLRGFAAGPTEVHRPGSAVRERRIALLKSSLILDDGSFGAFPPSPFGWSPNQELPRVGDRVSEVRGVVDGSGALRVHVARLKATSSGIPPVPAVGGDLKIAVLNVLNLFNGNGRGGGFPTTRGAATAEEFERQLAKLVATLHALDADVVALTELENDGYGPESALAQLATALNQRAPLKYATIRPESRLGTDDIAVGMLYRPETLTPIGLPQSLSAPPFDYYNRQPLLQAFAPSAGGLPFSVVVNHFKSKRCGEATDRNLDRGDGQGCWNAKRVEAARALAAWARERGGDRVFVLGDLNAYSREDPILALESAGFRNLTSSLTPAERYSYVFRGTAGALDHALVTPSLFESITGVGVWHINAGTADWLDYRKLPARADRYSESVLRSSDHDPLLIGLQLDPALQDRG